MLYNLMISVLFCRMDSSRMGIGTGRTVRRGRGRLKKVVTEDQVSEASYSNP